MLQLGWVHVRVLSTREGQWGLFGGLWVCIIVNRPLTLFQLLVFLRSVQMATNQKVLSNRASDKCRVCGVGSIVIAVSRAFQKGGGRLLSEQGLAPYTRL
jgi:hypothetical protein